MDLQGAHTVATVIAKASLRREHTLELIFRGHNVDFNSDLHLPLMRTDTLIFTMQRPLCPHNLEPQPRGGAVPTSSAIYDRDCLVQVIIWSRYLICFVGILLKAMRASIPVIACLGVKLRAKSILGHV